MEDFVTQLVFQVNWNLGKQKLRKVFFTRWLCQLDHELVSVISGISLKTGPSKQDLTVYKHVDEFVYKNRCGTH